MTRFNITLEEGVNFVLYALKNSLGYEIFVPKLKSYNILDLAKSVSSKAKINIIGIREGEKVHEEMISLSEGNNTIDLGKYYSILPSFRDYSIDSYIKKFGGKKVSKNFSYNSRENNHFLSVKEIKKLLKKMDTGD